NWVPDLIPRSMMLSRSSGITSPSTAGERMRAFLLVSLIALLVRVPSPVLLAMKAGSCASVPQKSKPIAFDLTFSGARQGFNWSWIKGGTPDEIDLPRRFRSVTRLTMCGNTTSTPTKIQPHGYVCVGFRDHIVQRLEFDDHEDHDKYWSDTDDCAC